VNRENSSERRADDFQRTRFGQVLRSSGMNKLPRLISVLYGELSIVGTHLFTSAPGKPFPRLDLRQVKPGLVTWAHANVDLRVIDDTIANIDRCIECDRFYIENSSFLFDVKVLLRALLSKQTYL
jgi:lipopolysaccharide/colanic/teichoic acid biosynthesis glycosyltransferase